MPDDAPVLRLTAARPDGDLGPLEAEYRCARLPGDVRLTRRLLLAWAASLLPLLVLQFTVLLDRPGFDVVRALNLGNLLLTLGTAAWLGGVRTPRRFDRGVGAWFAAMVLLIVVAQQFSGPRIAHGGALLVIATFTLLLPIPFFARVLPAVVLLVGSTRSGFEAAAADPELVSPYLRNAVVLAIGFAMALLVSTRNQRDRRRGFLDEQARLAAAARAAELGRLLPVCAYCGQVRRDDGFWEAASAHLARRRIVRGAGGLCERCGPAEGSAPPEPAAPEPSSPAAPEEDAAFRRACLPADRVLFAALLASVAVFFLVNAVRLAAEDPAVWALPVQWGRVGLALVSGALIPMVLRIRKPERLDAIAFGYLCGTVALACLVLLVAPSPSALMPILGVIMIHVLLHLPLWQRLLPALALSIVSVFAIVESTQQAGIFSVYTLVALVFANVVGVWASEARNADRRARFRALREQERAIERAEQLDWLLPMCGGCGQVRDDEGYWTDVFAYLERNSRYRASHGICPACVRAHFPEMAEDVLSPPAATPAPPPAGVA